MNGNTDRARLVGNRSGDSLTDPPCRVGGELEALCIVELLNRLDKTEVALLDQIEELHSSAEVALGNADNKTEVGFTQALLRGYVAV